MGLNLSRLRSMAFILRPSLPMTNDIIQKLNNHIGNGLAEEADVTYLFVQLGKLIERERPKSDCKVLSFYRNWVVHSTLSKGRG